MRVAGRVRYYIKQLLFIIVGNFPKIILLTQHFIHYCKGSIEQEVSESHLKITMFLFVVTTKVSMRLRTNVNFATKGIRRLSDCTCS